jgi:hypothetical protein
VKPAAHWITNGLGKSSTSSLKIMKRFATIVNMGIDRVPAAIGNPSSAESLVQVL